MRRILLIRLSSLGDIVLTSPAIRATRENFPDAYIAMLVGKKYVDLVSENPHLDEVIPFDKRSHSKDTTEMFRVVRELRLRDFEIAVDFQRKFRTSLLAYLSGARKRIGYHNPSGLMCSIPVPEGTAKHAVDLNLELLEKVGVRTNRRRPEMFVSQSDRDFANHILSGKKLRVGLFPGAGWELREWMPERFAEIANQCIDSFNAEIVIFGGRKERRLVQYVASLIKKQTVTFAGGLTLRELASMIERCSLFISNDTGPMHISVAMKTPTIALFGPGDPIKFQPIGNQHRMVRNYFPCSPCKQFTNRCKDNICMKSITVDRVWEVVESKLARIS